MSQPPHSPATDEDVRRSIRDAMQRLIEGNPIRSDGKLTIKSLATEAGVKRWVLTHKFKDLQDEFRARIVSHGAVPETLKTVLVENTGLKARVERQQQELKQAKAELGRYARIVQVQALENQTLQEQLRTLTAELTAHSTADEPN